MTISRKNFNNRDPATIPVDLEYVECNFSRRNPDTSGAQPKGVRLFPGDDTPRTFTDCNLLNCEVPPGSTINGKSNTYIMERDIPAFAETITVDGVVVDTKQYHDVRHHGRVNPQTLEYEYLPTPELLPQDY